VGLPALWPQYDRIVNERYGIEVRQLGCETNGMLDAYVHGYNGVIIAMVKAKFGADILDRAAARAEALSPSMAENKPN
jgi:hypothetical protein